MNLDYQGKTYGVKYNVGIGGIMENIISQCYVAKDQLAGHCFKSTKELYNYVKESFTYEADQKHDNWEVVKAPSALEKFRKGDCKTFAVYIAGVTLNEPHIKTYLRLVYYSYSDKQKGMAHVYVVIKCRDKTRVLDTVNGKKYNDEMSYYSKKDYPL